MDCHDGGQQNAGVFAFVLRRAIVAVAILTQPVNFAAAQTDEPVAPMESTAESSVQPVEASLRNDAALADVFFVDGASGWAVGERGVVWHTSDGGQTWRQQASGVVCRLNSAFFIDKRRGWAAGGSSRPHAGWTQGVVLQTLDGGVTWTPVQETPLPLLTRIKFFDANIGVAIGAGSAAHPSGVFVTRDGGQNWKPLPADRAGHWLAGDFLDADSGAVAESAGQFATIARRQVVHSSLATPSLRGVHSLRLLPPSNGWLVGDGGLVMATRDLGHSWQSPSDELPHNAAERFDFHALAVHEQQVWIAGSPGTRVFHSPDGGESWQAFVTGQFAPIRAMTFLDAMRGWTAGDLGCILGTSDGGRTWQLQRAGGRRAALLALFAGAGDVPLEVIAEHGAAEGYIMAVNLLHADVAARGRSREAMILAGAAAAETAWRFPLPSGNLALTPADLLAVLNRENDGRAIEQLENHLVRTLRMWRPDVVLTRHTGKDEDESIAAAVEELVLRAVDAAGDPTQFVELATDAGLEPWQIKKVYGVLPPGSRGQESVITSSFSPWLGASLADWTAPARRLLLATHVSTPETHELRLLLGEPALAGGPHGLFRGISLARGSDARRAAPEMPPNDLEELRRLAARRRHLQELLERSEGNVAWAGQVATLTDGLDARGAGELLFQLAAGYRSAGRLDLAADTYYLLAQRYPEHPLVDDALLWLIQFYASSEAAHRAAAPVNTRPVVEPAAGDVALAGTGEPRSSHQQEEVVQAVAVESISGNGAPAIGLSRDDRLRRASQIADYLKSARPMLYAEPAVRFAEVAAQRELGYSNAAKRYFLTLGQRPASDPWRRCAETEQWLARPAELPPPKMLATCRRTFERPHLDGRLDEPFWSTADRMQLRGEAGVGRTILSVNRNNTTDKIVRPTDSADVRLIYDDAFFYIAIRCPKAIGGEYPADDRPRPRDADLSQHDRVTLWLDLDRDFTTAFELTVDHRGWTHEACWGDANWNPSWYVAAASDDTTWTVEAAVPLSELTATPPAPKHVWAVAARRTIPRVGYETWEGRAGPGDSPDEFGMLIFE